ncbi:MAG TPA: PKD domain-containing protein [Thermoanaerobaculia bacterium]
MHKRFESCLLLMLLVFALPLHAVVKPNPECPQTQAGHPITEVDQVRWPSAPGVVRIEVLGNDYDVEGDPLKVTSVTPIPPANGSVSVSSDQQAINFVPGTKPGADLTFGYTASDGTRSTPGTVVLLVKDPTPPPGSAVPDFTVTCEYLRCAFRALANGVTEIRAFQWNVQNHLYQDVPTCSPKDWRSYTYTCFAPQAGTYYVGLTVTRFNGERVSTPTMRPIQVQLDPAQIRWVVQDAPASNPAATPGLKTSFIMEYTNRDQCDIQCPHSFDFGDGSPIVPAGKNPSNLGWQGGATSHAYKLPGIYNVRVIVGGGQTPEVFAKAIEVRNKVPEILNFNVSTPTPTGAVTVYGDPSDELDIHWIGDTPDPNGAPITNLDFGDGTQVSIDSGGWGDPFAYTYKYKAPGKYTITARLADGFGAAGVYTREVDIANVPPVPSFTFDCDPALRRCTFDASASKDAGGSIVSYNWKATSTASTLTLPSGASIDYVFPAGLNMDNWAVELTVTDNTNAAVALSRPVRFAAFRSQPLEYFALTQRRILNTKQTGTPVTRDQPQEVDLNACCGINLPGYGAVAVNISAIEPNHDSDKLIVRPGTTTLEGPLMDVFGTANTNTPVSANAVVTTIDGKFTISRPGQYSSTHVIVDLFGVFAPKDFVPPADLAGPNRFRTVEPCRALDTRFTPPALTAGVDRALKLRDVCGIGSDAVAVVGGIASINNASSYPDGYITVFPSNRTDGNGTSSLNTKAPFIRSNGIWPRLSGLASDDVKIRLNVGTSDVAVDTAGYFVPKAAGGLRYVALPPCPLGSAVLTSGHQKTFKVAGNCGVPQGAAAAMITHRVSSSFFSGHVILYGAYRQPPGTSNGNYSTSEANPLANFHSAGTSVVKLQPAPDGDLAAVAYFTGTAPDFRDILYGVEVEPWVWGYFTAAEDNEPPTPSFDFNCWDYTCRFDASASADQDGSILKYEWKFLPSAPVVTGKTASYTFAASLTTAVQLIVTDDKGATAMTTRTVSISNSAAYLQNMNYFSLPPCRLHDSTNLVPGGQIQVRGECGIPAYTGILIPVLNVVVQSSEAGDGLLQFGGSQELRYSSTALPLAFHRTPLMFWDDQQITFTLTKAARVIVDVVGYYRASESPAAPARGPLRFTALDPCRAFDSRITGPALSGGVRQDIDVAWNCGVPAGATATAHNLTAVNPALTGGGNIRLWPSNLAIPNTSVLNVIHGLNRGNFTYTELGTTQGAARDLALQLSTGTSHFVLDVHGYFSPDSKQRFASKGGLLTQGPMTLTSGVPVSLKVKGNGGVPLHATAALIQVEGSGTTSPGHLTLYASDKLRPATSALNFAANQTTPVTNTVIVPLAATGETHLSAVASLSTPGTAKVSMILVGYFYDPTDWGPVTPSLEWTVASQVGLGLDLDITSLNIDPLSPEHAYFVDWGDGTAQWTAENGSIVLAARPSHTYTTTGARNVTVGVRRKSDGSEIRFTKSIRIGNAPPVVNLTFDCTFAPTCTFDASGSTDDYNEIQKYFWDVGTGAQTTVPTLTHTFPGEGTYPIVVTAWDGVSESAAVKRTLQVRVPKADTAYLFQPATPCRLFDSRNSTPLSANSALSLQVGGQCGIPATAKAVALNVAVVTSTGDGYIRVYEPGKLTETANQTFSASALPRSNHVTASLDSTGKLAVMVTVGGSPASANVIVDVTGYYSAATGLGFRTLTPCRAFQSQNTSPPSPLVSGTVSTLKLRGRCGIPDTLPAGGAAAAMNLTVINPATFGNVVMVPSSGTDTTSTSTVNVMANRNTAAGATLGLGLQPNDDLSLRYVSTGPGNSAHWVVDVSGYWAAGNELRYYPLPGCRMLDTRYASHGYPALTAGVEQRVQARGNCGVPLWAKAIAVNATVIAGNPGGNLLLWPAGTSAPGTSNVNWVAGEPFIGNMTIVPVGSALPDLSIRSVSGANVVLDVFGYFADPADVPAGYFTLESEEEEQ